LSFCGVASQDNCPPLLVKSGKLLKYNFAVFRVEITGWLIGE
jgi:hypothetical protein